MFSILFLVLLLYDEVRLRKDLKTFLSFLGEVTPFKFKNNLRVPLGAKPEKFKNSSAKS